MIYAAREAENESWDGLGFSPSMLGTDCDRAIWLQWRWAMPAEKFGGRMLRLFETGHIQEDRLIADLKRAGLEVYETDPETGKQWLARALGDHVRGKLDGICRGVPEAPTKWHVVECKSHNKASFAKLLKPGGLRVTKFDHWLQCQIYCHIRGIDRALYIAVNKDTDELYCERVRYDHEYCTHLMARLERLIRTPEPPPGICRNADDFAGKWCRARALCFENSFARVTCRSCVHSSPEMTGNAAWSCQRHVKPLSPDEQRAGCVNHLFVPALVPGELLDVDEAAETISYRLHDGREWTDGRDVSERPIEVESETND